MKGWQFLGLSNSLEEALCERSWTKIAHCYTIEGTCKLSLYQEAPKLEEKKETDEKKPLQTRKAKIIEISHLGEMLQSKEITLQAEGSIKQEEICLNYIGTELFVQVDHQESEKKDSPVVVVTGENPVMSIKI